MLERTGIRHRRLHASRRCQKIFRRNPGRLLRSKAKKRRETFPLCRKSGDWVHGKDIVDLIQKVPGRTTTRLSIRRSALKAGRKMGAGDYAGRNAQMHLGQPGVRVPGQVRGVDAGWKAAPTGVSWIA